MQEKHQVQTYPIITYVISKYTVISVLHQIYPSIVYIKDASNDSGQGKSDFPSRNDKRTINNLKDLALDYRVVRQNGS